MGIRRTADRNDLASRAREIIRLCRALAVFSEDPGSTTRTFLSPPMRDVHARLGTLMASLGMEVAVDAAGNLRGTHGAGTAAPRLFIGSHLDTVPQAGAFDGVLGVVIGVALVSLMIARSAGRRLPFTIEVVGFSEEEGVRFGVPFIGSRALAGSADDRLLNRRDAAGVSVREAIESFGLDPARIGEARAGAGALGYLEFHIEQGPVLDTLGFPLGLVEIVKGQSRLDVRFTGRASHAGTTPMELRRDAVAGAAEWILAVEHEARASGGLVATVGRVDALPGAGNVVAGACRASLDVRHADDRIRTDRVARLTASAQEIAAARGLSVTWEALLDQPAVTMNPVLVSALERAVASTGRPVHRMASGAGHDAMIVADLMPAAMLFLRSPDGISHHPDEAVLEEDVAAALEAGREFLEDLARRARDSRGDDGP